MLNEILKQLKEAINKNDRKKIQACKRVLNRNGMDDYTIQLLLQRL